MNLVTYHSLNPDYMFLLLLFLNTATCIIDAVTDMLLIKRGRLINHSLSIIPPLVILAAGLLFLTEFKREFITYPEVQAALLLFPFMRWVIHDMLLNHFRGLPQDYLGTGSNAALTDRFLGYFKTRGLHPSLIRFTFLSLALIGAVLIMKL